jgi:hypothetical protein
MAKWGAIPYICAGGAAMPTTVRKTKAAAPATRTTKSRKAIAEAVHQYMAVHFGSVIAQSALASGPELDAMFAEIDRNLDASEQCTARLLAAQD